MDARKWLALLCLLVGIVVLAYGLTIGNILLIIVGFALELVFLYQLMQWISGAGKPAAPIKPAANSAWTMKDQPAAPPRSEEPK